VSFVVCALDAFALCPTLQLHTNLLLLLGFKRYTNAAEESERLRRLANKSECYVHKMNAHKVAGMVYQIGWPFIKHAPKGNTFAFSHEFE
jgi:hypothetical protein